MAAGNLMHIAKNRKSKKKSGQIEITLQGERTRKYTSELMADSLLALFLVIGIEEFICSLFQLKTHIEFLLPVSMAVILLFCFIQKSRGMRFLATGIVAVWLLVLCALTKNDMLNGLKILANAISDTLGNYYGRIFPKYQVLAKESDYMVCITLFLLPVVVLLALFCVYLVKSGGKLLYFLVVAAALMGQFAMGSATSLFYLALILLCGIFLRMQRRKLSEVCTVTAAAGLVVAATLLILSLAGVKSSEFAAILRTGSLQAMDELRYHTAKETILPEGNFLKAGKIEGEHNDIALNVTMSTPQSYYLRGYVGEVYTKSSWQKADTSRLYDYRNTFYWLHKENFYGQTQLADAANLLDDSLMEPNDITIENVNASSKYLYMPYELLNYQNVQEAYANEIGDSRDTVQGLKGERNYHYMAWQNEIKNYPVLVQNLGLQEDSADVRDYLEKESYYNAFVYDTYTQIPDSTRNMLQNHLGKYDGTTHMPYEEAKDNILTYLSEHVIYSTGVSAMPAGGDFLQYFLEESGSGYSVHYATAAVMMFRYYGIPARYVEGYLVTPEDIKGVEEGSTISIPENHAHAWAEYYQDGIGWIPFEVTPSYLNVMEQPQKVTGLESPDTEKPEDETNLELTGDNYEPDERDEEADSISGIVISLVILLIMLLLLAGGLWFLRHQRSRKWQQALHSEAKREAVLSTMAYCMTVLSIWKCSGGKRDYRKDVETFIQKYELKASELEKSFDILIHIYELSHYSTRSLGEEEVQQAQETYGLLKQWIKEQKRGKDLFLRIRAFFKGL